MSFSGIIADPPYDLGNSGMMGMAWDRTGVAFDPETWRLVLRLLKPGAHTAIFGGPRTFHRGDRGDGGRRV